MPACGWRGQDYTPVAGKQELETGKWIYLLKTATDAIKPRFFSKIKIDSVYLKYLPPANNSLSILTKPTLETHYLTTSVRNMRK